MAAINPLRYRGYYYDEETGLYYLMSRYYDPQTGRFINADSYASTGQGFSGYNMFAYCGNSPIGYVDSTGLRFESIENDARELVAVMALGAAAAVVLNPSVAETVVKETDRALSKARKEVYEYAQAFKDLTASIYEDHQPRVHHIVPYGKFSTRSLNIQVKVRKMQEILTKAGITPETHPLNLIVVSQGYHKSLHTDRYLEFLYNELSRVEGNDDAVRKVLLEFRIIIAAGDPYATGY